MRLDKVWFQLLNMYLYFTNLIKCFNEILSNQKRKSTFVFFQTFKMFKNEINIFIEKFKFRRKFR